MLLINFDFLKNAVDVYTVILSIIGLLVGTYQLRRHLRYRHIKKILGIRDGEKVLLVCSELDEPAKRQLVEEREFIYLMKYGDVDAWVETLFSLLRIYPNIDLWLLSAGEVANTRVDFDDHIILIGGPDYNSLVGRFLKMGVGRMRYRSPDTDERSAMASDEIALFDTLCGKEYLCKTLDDDYGYFERVKNPYNKNKNIIIIGGCHTVGVTGAAKFFSAFSEGRPEIMAAVEENAREVHKRVGKHEEFCLICHVEKIGATISTPTIRHSRLFTGTSNTPAIDHLKT